MKLLVDIGNSRIKWALADGERLFNRGASIHYGTLNDIPIQWSKFVTTPNGVYCASVAGDTVTGPLQQWVRQNWGLQMQMLKSRRRCCGVENGYRQPQMLGIDRWAALIAAHQISTAPLCVVDCGSAITVDALDGNGRHLGGLIAPGLRLQQEALQQSTAVPINSNTEQDRCAWGQDTHSGIHSGTICMLAGLIERSYLSMNKRFNTTVELFITGGDAKTITTLLDLPLRHEEHLVLQGVARIVLDHDG